jgi:hypothetical protein
MIARIPIRMYTPVICYDLSAAKSSALQRLRKVRAGILEYVVSTLHQLCSSTLGDVHRKLRWLAQSSVTPHELHERQTFCDSLDDLLSGHRQFVMAAEAFSDVLAQFNCAVDDACSSAMYSSVYLPHSIVKAVEEQKPSLQELLRKFVQEHQQELAGFLADLQQTETDIRQFHSYSDIDRTEAYVTSTRHYIFVTFCEGMRMPLGTCRFTPRRSATQYHF